MRRPIIAITHTTWHQPWWMSRQQLMSRLARDGWPVIYSNGPMKSWDRHSAHWRETPMLGGEEFIPFGTDGGGVLLDSPPRALHTTQRSAFLSRLVMGAYARRLRRMSKRLSHQDPIVFLTIPRFIDIARKIRSRAIVLYVNDRWWRMKGWNNEAQQYLQESVERADLIICAAQTMADELPGRGPHEARVLPHGVDIEAFSELDNAPCPEDIEGIPRPRLGYVGRLSRKVDFKLVFAIAIERPDWHWVFIGKAGAGFRGHEEEQLALESLAKLPNVHLLGVRNREVVPRYMLNMDINTIPIGTQTDDYWVGGTPTKLFEYLAAERPVISTPLETVKPWKAVVRLASTPDAWIETIEDTLRHEDDDALRKQGQIARENSWDHRAELLSKWIADL